MRSTLLSIAALCALLMFCFIPGSFAAPSQHQPSYTLVIVWQGYRAGAMTTVPGYTSAASCMASGNYMRQHAAVDTYCLLVE